MSFPWLKLAVNFPSHPKNIRLQQLLKDRNAGMEVIRGWIWSSANAPDGVIQGPRAGETLENAVGWQRKKGLLVESMIEAGWLDQLPPDALAWHDWLDHQGAVLTYATKQRLGALRRRTEKIQYVENSRRTTLARRSHDARGAEGDKDQDQDLIKAAVVVTNVGSGTNRQNTAAEFSAWLLEAQRIRSEVVHLPPIEKPSQSLARAFWQANPTSGPTLLQRYREWMHDPWARTRKPPFALRAFLSDGSAGWRRYDRISVKPNRDSCITPGCERFAELQSGADGACGIHGALALEAWSKFQFEPPEKDKFGESWRVDFAKSLDLNSFSDLLSSDSK